MSTDTHGVLSISEELVNRASKCVSAILKHFPDAKVNAMLSTITIWLDAETPHGSFLVECTLTDYSVSRPHEKEDYDERRDRVCGTAGEVVRFIAAHPDPTARGFHHEGCDVMELGPQLGHGTKPCNCACACGYLSGRIVDHECEVTQ